MGVFKNIKEGWTNYLNFFYRNDRVTPEIKELAKSKFKKVQFFKTKASRNESKAVSYTHLTLPTKRIV